VNFLRIKEHVDFAGFIIYDEEDQEGFFRLQSIRKEVHDVLESEPGYFSWELNAEFPLKYKENTNSD